MTKASEELKRIQIEDDIDRIELFGNMDANLNLIQDNTGVEIFQRDDCLLLRGEEIGPPGKNPRRSPASTAGLARMIF